MPSSPVGAASAVQVEISPSGTVKNVRQFTARFSQPMVSFGDPRLADPMVASCAVPGRGRWVDTRTWVYDFVRDLPGGLDCTFSRRDPLHSLAGVAIDGPGRHRFSTGGPAIVASSPRSGDERINEDQVFVLALDARATTASVLANAWCTASGVNERIALRIVTGSLRAAILARSETVSLAEYPSSASAPVEMLSAAERRSNRLLVRCTRTLPSDSEVRLVWGKGIRTDTGIEREADQLLTFRTRPEFRARFSCARANQAAQCIPVLPMRVVFSAPISPADADAIRLKGADGRLYRPRLAGDRRAAPRPASAAHAVEATGGGAADDATEKGIAARLRGWWHALATTVTRWLDSDWHRPGVESVEFVGPFPENATFTLELPARMRDDAGRLLANAASFPLAVRTDEDPPLIRFAARFGVVEANAGALLPVTVRNIDAQGVQAGTEGRLLRVDDPTPRELVRWMRRADEGGGDEAGEPGRRSILRDQPSARELLLPRTTGPREFEVIGIPLQRPGFYVVEFASPRLGAALLDTEEAKAQREAIDRAVTAGLPRPVIKPPAVSRDPYHVPATALVTNLGAHFKRGREGSLVWVTSLDRGEPVEGARVQVLDCDGNVFHDGMSDRDGIVRVEGALPLNETLPGCATRYDRQLMVTARLANDFTFTLSGWNEGIAPWRFNLPTGAYDGPYALRAVLDRSLLRAGETVHMKLFARENRRAGFSVPPVDAIEPRVIIEHVGSNQRHQVPAVWERNGSALAQWDVPASARLGTYRILVQDRLPVAGTPDRLSPRATAALARVSGAESSGASAGASDLAHLHTREVGEFRVEAFRLPTLRATVKAPSAPLVAVSEAAVDVQLAYLSGGPAGGAPVRLRTASTPRAVSFPRFDGFVFANGDVLEGVIAERAGPGLLDEHETDAEALAADGRSAGSEGDGRPGDERGLRLVGLQSATLDASGGARLRVPALPAAQTPRDLLFELEYRDANGETLTSTARAAWWPSAVVVGVRAENWVISRNRVKMQAVVVDPEGRPMANVPVSVDMLRRESFSHRRRLLGGFYAFETYTDVARVGSLCSGRTDAGGRIDCEGRPPVSGNLILRARAVDGAGRASIAHREVWIAGPEDWWFDVQDSDRMDVLPESPRYEPGQTARFQVRMPFRSARALVTIEREGVIDGFVRTLSGNSPVVEVPVANSHAPNVFVSVLAVRGRVGEVAPTATVDLGKPAYRMGIGEIAVGWRVHELQVEVKPERAVYRVRDAAQVAVRVRRADGSIPPVGTEIALAAVDEALLELGANDTWPLLQRMMGRRGIEVVTSTAQMHVVGRRHFGRKAVLPGGGGGQQASRELFDTLLAWRGRIILDANGEASVTVPLNDSLTSFRIVAIASGNGPSSAGLFGTGSASLRTTQDLMLVSALPALAREGDRFDAQFTVRNASERPLAVAVSASARPLMRDPEATTVATEARTIVLAPQSLLLAPGEATQVRWPFDVPAGVSGLTWEMSASGGEATRDRLRVEQRVVPAVPVRTLQASLVQLAAAGQPGQVIPLQRPADALPDRGAIEVSLASSLGGDLREVRDYMRAYPYTCLEQLVSRAIVLDDRAAWDRLTSALPTYLDRDGLARYFPMMRDGSDVLTTYLLALSDEAGWPLPKASRDAMLRGLERFVQGRLDRSSGLPAADRVLRRIAALDALARHGVTIEPGWLESLVIEPQAWPTSTLIDWMSLLARAQQLPLREPRLAEAERILRARLTVQGTVMGFSTEKSDRLWWLMVSGDVNANRMLLRVVDDPRWADDLPRLVRGALGRQQRGRWDTTVANAWGVLAMARFTRRFETQPVTGSTLLAASTSTSTGPDSDSVVRVDWPARAGAPVGPVARGQGTASIPAIGDTREVGLPWPAQGKLTLRHDGSGRPWATVRSRAAVPLRERLDAGLRIERTVSVVEQKVPGRWSVGDLMQVRLSVEAQSDLTWVVLSDPVPAGSTVLGSGLGGQSSLAAASALDDADRRASSRRTGCGATAPRLTPVFEERSFEDWRGYWQHVPKGSVSAAYVLRLNQSGRFELPSTRAEAMYAPEVFGELPNVSIEVAP